MGTIFVDNLEPQSGTNLTLGASGDTISLASGASQTLAANTPNFSVSKNANQSVATSTDTLITWETENYDTDNAFASNKFTVPTGKGGKYLCSASVRIEYGNASGEYGEIKIYKNGSQYRANFNAVSGNAVRAQNLNICVTMDLSAGDYVEIYVFHTKGTSQDALTGDNTYFFMHRLVGA